MKTQSRYNLRRDGNDWLVFWLYSDGSRGERSFMTAAAARLWIAEQYFADKDFNARVARCRLAPSKGGYSHE